MTNSHAKPVTMPSRDGRGRVTVQMHDRPRFKQLMTDRDLTLRELARAVTCSYGHLRDIHSGHQARVSLRLATKIELHLGCQPGELFKSLDAPDKTADQDVA